MRRSGGSRPIDDAPGRIPSGGPEPRTRLAHGMTRTQRLWLSLAGLTVSLGAAAWLVASVGEMHDRLARTSPGLAVGFVAVAVLAASGTAIGASRLLWKLGRDERP